MEGVEVLLLEADGEGDVVRVRNSPHVLDPAGWRAARNAVRRRRRGRQREQQTDLRHHLVGVPAPLSLSLVREETRTWHSARCGGHVSVSEVDVG